VSDKKSTRKPAVLIIGAPGAGKGTQGQILGTIPRFFHFACGDVFRSLDTRTALGQRFVHYSSRGELVPDELTIELWLAQLEAWVDMHLYKSDIDILILDGIPRNAEQAAMLEAYLEIHQVFHLSCPNRDELARRMRKRALKENRMDDASDEVINRRISTYEAETKPILDYYSDELVTEIDASQTPAKVLHDILSRMMSLPVYVEMAKVKV
jgi:adenylate kinase